MRTIFPFSLMLALSFLNASAQESKDSGALEPKNRFELIINGKTYQAVEGEPLTLDPMASKSSLVIRLSDRKTINAASLSFDYPRHLSFEYERNTGLGTWTLNGNSLVVTIFAFDAQISLNTLVAPMVEKFGKENCTVDDFKKEFGHQSTSGKRLHVKLAGTNVIIDFYDLGSSHGKYRIMSFQDAIKENGETSDEFKAGFQMIDNSIKFL